MATQQVGNGGSLTNIDLLQTDVAQLREAIKWRIDQIHQSLSTIHVLTDVTDNQSTRQQIYHILQEIAHLTRKAEELEQHCAEQFWYVVYILL